jgi:hypothetical protein
VSDVPARAPAPALAKAKRRAPALARPARPHAAPAEDGSAPSESEEDSADKTDSLAPASKTKPKLTSKPKPKPKPTAGAGAGAGAGATAWCVPRTGSTRRECAHCTPLLAHRLNEADRVRRAKGRLDLSQYAVEEGDEVALILPAYAEFLETCVAVRRRETAARVRQRTLGVRRS